MISRNLCNFGIWKQMCLSRSRYTLCTTSNGQFYRLSQSTVHPWSNCSSFSTHGARSYCFSTKVSQHRQNRFYSTVSEKGATDQQQTVATPQLLSKLFPQTAIEGSEHEAQLEKQRKEEEEEKKEKESSWKRMKFGFVFFGFSVSAFCVYIVWIFGAPDRDAEGNIIEDEFMGLPTFQQYFRRLWKSMTYYQKMIQEPSREKLLPDPLKYPYAQPPYTLVLEMKDVLVHPDWTYQTGWRFKKRPGVDKFLETLAANYEIVVFTADQGMTVFPILDALDPRGYIMYRLVRDATHFVDGHHVKNLDNLNRDLSKVIVVDWDPNSTKLHPENTLNIPRWTGNDDDSGLFDLMAMLVTIATTDVEDVREVMTYYKSFDNPLAKFRENQRLLAEQMAEKEQEEKQRNLPAVQRWRPSFLGGGR
ncbi:mitochondrial import inner membrane translocase subunit TIM50-C-like [Anopheles ziemanni]|uniref:mitochondrial import inner membrane translocase subunit TIM50-C-like n=1 Tax=Anopheles coustani TaxID=139045 RepID=UPI0026583C92|nr:mitochondrial import inner membrane translocase subunit TIM50-C-like [Anopheles coustani]XP_058171659.1 mitochondrial import inner membrane translocase subunit TIM50-C-like [Anopheles ziemanni]